MGRVFLEYLSGDQVYVCNACHCHLADREELVSKNFHGKTGKAYLFNKISNALIGPEEEKIMMTGLHRVCDISCKGCLKTIGWTYVYAYEESEKYKEGKYIIERAYLKKQGSKDKSQ